MWEHGFEPRWDCSVYCLVMGVMEVSTSTPWANFFRPLSVCAFSGTSEMAAGDGTAAIIVAR